MMRRVYLAHGWLPAVLPADTARLRVADADLTGTLAAAGGRFVEYGADVEIGQVEDISTDARFAIVPVDGRVTDSHRRVQQVVGRLAAHAAVRRGTVRAAAALRRRGFTHVRIISWDRDQAIRFPGTPAWAIRSLSERLPRHALVVASREPPGPTILERALGDAQRRTGLRLTAVRPLVSSGTLVVLLENHVLRIAIGPATELIEHQAATLVTLRSLSGADAIAERVPQPLASGCAGLAEWSLESRLPGSHPPTTMAPHLVDASLDFLIALFRLRTGRAGSLLTRSLVQMEGIARGCLPQGAFMALCERAVDVDDELRVLPRGFCHGDFAMQNLLVRGGRLVGVIDWAQAEPEGLPLVDVLNLVLLQETHPDLYQWGPAIVGYLLPLARRGGSEPMRRWLRASGLDLSPHQIERLVHAYWLYRVRDQLSTYIDRSHDRLWLEQNVMRVLSAIEVAAR